MGKVDCPPGLDATAVVCSPFFAFWADIQETRFVCLGLATVRSPGEIELWSMLISLGDAWTQSSTTGEVDHPPGLDATAVFFGVTYFCDVTVNQVLLHRFVTAQKANHIWNQPLSAIQSHMFIHRCIIRKRINTLKPFICVYWWKLNFSFWLSVE